MRAAMGFLLAFTMSCPTAFPRPVSAAAVRDYCPICGHACCCPDICAPKIKALKAGQMRACANDSSLCRLSTNDDRASMDLKDSLLRPEQTPGIASDAPIATGLRRQAVSDLEAVLPASPVAEIHTPPPRLNA